MKPSPEPRARRAWPDPPRDALPSDPLPAPWPRLRARRVATTRRAHGPRGTFRLLNGTVRSSSVWSSRNAHCHAQSREVRDRLRHSHREERSALRGLLNIVITAVFTRTPYHFALKFSRTAHRTAQTQSHRLSQANYAKPRRPPLSDRAPARRTGTPRSHPPDPSPTPAPLCSALSRPSALSVF
jgi:hypothetical protein